MGSMLGIYYPSAAATMTQMLESYQANDSAKWKLSRDFATALAYLHENRIMHRDLSSSNLCITSLRNPKGILINFDMATMKESSTEFDRGTLPFMAPEVSTWDRDEPPPGSDAADPAPYTCKVDVWSLGLNLWALYRGTHWSWNDYGSSTDMGFVTRPLYTTFRSDLVQQCDNAAGSSFNEAMIDLIEDMVEWDPKKRSTASKILDNINDAADLVRGQQALTEPKKVSPSKRGAGEPSKKSEVEERKTKKEKVSSARLLVSADFGILGEEDA